MKTEIDLIEGEHVGDVFRHANAKTVVINRKWQSNSGMNEMIQTCTRQSSPEIKMFCNPKTCEYELRKVSSWHISNVTNRADGSSTDSQWSIDIPLMKLCIVQQLS